MLLVAASVKIEADGQAEAGSAGTCYEAALGRFEVVEQDTWSGEGLDNSEVKISVCHEDSHCLEVDCFGFVITLTSNYCSSLKTLAVLEMVDGGDLGYSLCLKWEAQAGTEGSSLAQARCSGLF